jgi:copper(I)-binding protein
MRCVFIMMPIVMLSACQQAAPKSASIEHAWVRLPAVEGRPGAAYFTLHGGPVDDRLMSVSSPQAIKSEMHDMSMAGGIMKMAPINGGLAVPAKGKVTFESSGKHVMLFDVSPKVVSGGKMALTFAMASGQTLEADADVVTAGGDEPHHGK